MTATKTNEIANLARSLKRIADDDDRPVRTASKGRSGIVRVGDLFIVTTPDGYAVYDGWTEKTTFLPNMQAAREYARKLLKPEAYSPA